GKFELQAAADGPAPVPMLLHDCAWRSERLVFNLGERSAPRRVEQPIVLCVADPAPVSCEPRLPHVVAETGEANGWSKFEGRPSFAGDGGVALIAIDDGAVLDVQARGDADDTATQVEVRRLIDASGIILDDGIAPGSTP